MKKLDLGQLKKDHLYSSTLTKGPVRCTYLLTTFPSINRSKVPLLPNKKGKLEYSWWTCKIGVATMEKSMGSSSKN